MHRPLSHTVHYKPPKNERRHAHSFVMPDLSWLINKTILEVSALCVILGSGAWLLAYNQYFQINDVMISGLDSYGSEITNQTVRTYLQKNTFGVPHQTYLGLSTDEITKQLTHALALDTIHVEKIFPHTLQIEATETPVKMKIHAPNGDAFVSANGLLVRWYPAGSTDEMHITGPEVLVNEPETPQGPLQPVLSAHDQLVATTVCAAGDDLDGLRLQTVEINADDPEHVLLTYEQGTQLLITGNADIGIQVQKASMALAKAGYGKQIDVRFGDKVFVTAIASASTTPHE